MDKANKFYIPEDEAPAETVKKYKSTFLFTLLKQSLKRLFRGEALSEAFFFLSVFSFSLFKDNQQLFPLQYPFQLCCVT